MTEIFDAKRHWEKIYKTKELPDLSWYQSTPATSLDFIKESCKSKDSKIVDIGGGDSLLMDHLMKMDFRDITVLDISETAISKAKERLGTEVNQVKWITCDVRSFVPEEKYDIWHDRAAFHFLTDKKDIESYIENARKAINSGGKLIIGTFSEKGPETCSGRKIKQYSRESMKDAFGKYFQLINCKEVIHKTPSGSIQDFIFCSFQA